MINLYVNIDQLRDMKLVNDHRNTSEIIKCGKEHIANGGTVVIQQEYSNVDPTEVIRLNNNDSFNEWINDFFIVVNKSNTGGTT